MYCRSISFFICMFMAVSLATLHRDNDPTKDWSTQESAGELAWLLDAGDGAIVTLQAGGTHLVVHRSVLVAGSPVLADIVDYLFSDEDTGGDLIVRNMEGPVLRHLVAYLYTRRTPRLSPGTATRLLAAAHKYDLPALQADCERQVAAQLTVENAAAAAVLAVNLSADHLRDAAVNFIKDHRIRVLATEGWADALQNHPKEAAQVTHLLADRLAGICGPATMEAETTQPSATPVTAAPALASCPTTPLDEDAVSRLRNLSKEERDRRLMLAAKQGAVGELRELLAAGADVCARNGTFYTALHIAAMKGRVEAAAALLELGADREAENDAGNTPVDDARKEDQQQLIEILTRD